MPASQFTTIAGSKRCLPRSRQTCQQSVAVVVSAMALCLASMKMVLADESVTTVPVADFLREHSSSDVPLVPFGDSLRHEASRTVRGRLKATPAVGSVRPVSHVLAEDGMTVEGPADGTSTTASDEYSVIESSELPVTASGDVVDVSVDHSRGMLLDESYLDEMPFPASSGRWFNSGFWYASGESLWLDRSRTYRRPVAAEAANPDIVYTTMAQPFDVAPGARATLGRSLGRDHLNRDRFIEFTYYGGMSYQDVDGWNALVPGSLFSPLAPLVPGFNGADTYGTSLDSDFNSYEWNFKLRRRLGRDQMVMLPNGDWTRHAERAFLPAMFVGVRLANVNEDFSLVSRRNGVASSQFGGDYTINAENWLLGMNFGGELISQNERFYWGVRGRGAPCLSFASTTQTVVGSNTVDPLAAGGAVSRQDAATQTGPGFLGDLSLLAGWNITPNFSLKAGYEFLWVAGIATATRQFNLDDRRQDPIDGGGQVFYNGLSFGFEGSW